MSRSYEMVIEEEQDRLFNKWVLESNSFDEWTSEYYNQVEKYFFDVQENAEAISSGKMQIDPPAMLFKDPVESFFAHSGADMEGWRYEFDQQRAADSYFECESGDIGEMEMFERDMEEEGR